MRIHIVQKGETLWRIAKQYGVSLEELKRLNSSHLTNPDYIVPGMEIILPAATVKKDSPNTNPTTNMTKDRLTAPITKEEKTAPISKEEKTAPITKEEKTAPISKEEKTKPLKEKLTEPIKEIVKEVKEEIKEIKEMPLPQLDLQPQFHFDFAPQMHFEKPEKTQPMPQPQPIFIEVPQPPMPKPETKIETKVEKQVEYVPVPQQQIVYVPYFPVCPPKPCCKKHHRHHHGCQPNPCDQFYPYGMMPQMMAPEMMPQQMMPQQMMTPEMMQPENVQPETMQPEMVQPAMMPQQMMPQQMMQPQMGDCGCGGPQTQPAMMQYDLPYFEPNYDCAPSMDVAPAEVAPQMMDTEMVDANSDGIPDWLQDSSELKNKTTINTTEQQPMMTDQYGGMPNFDVNQYANVNPSMYTQDCGQYPMYPYMGGHMHYMMPQQYPMMPQQGVQSMPNVNPQSQQYKPWNY